jgi:hypothetical protein
MEAFFLDSHILNGQTQKLLKGIILTYYTDRLLKRVTTQKDEENLKLQFFQRKHSKKRECVH